MGNDVGSSHRALSQAFLGFLPQSLLRDMHHQSHRRFVPSLIYTMCS